MIFKRTRKEKSPKEFGSIIFNGIEFKLIKRPVRYTRIIYKKKDPTIIIPFGVSPQTVLEENRNRILKKIRKFNQAVEESNNLEIFTYKAGEFEVLIEDLVAEHSDYLGVKARVIKFRTMKRRWGTCYSTGMIILNRKIEKLPRHLISFILFHELLHIRIKTHDKKFKDQIQKRFPDVKDIDKELSLFGLRLLGD